MTGYDTYAKLLTTIGSDIEKVMSPGWNSIRNFHGLWFADGDVLNEMFDHQHQTIDEFCKAIVQKFPVYKAASAVPSGLISAVGFKRLLGTENSPLEWVKQGDKGRIRAFFGSEENVKCMAKSWKEFPVLAKGEVADGNIDYDAIRKTENIKKYGFLLNHGYDESKPDSELDLEDMKGAAAYRGGKCLRGEHGEGRPLHQARVGVPRRSHLLRVSLHGPEGGALVSRPAASPSRGITTGSRSSCPSTRRCGTTPTRGRRTPSISSAAARRCTGDIDMKVLFTVFSASGNTARVCRLFSERLKERGAECETVRIREDMAAPDYAAADTLVIGYPVHGFNAPQNVVDFAKGLPECENKVYYIIKTSGEPLHVNDASSRILDRTLKKKGYVKRGEFHYVMPYNMIFRHSDDMAALMWQAARNTAPADADMIFEGREQP